jgi:hypothetical protein
MKLAIAQIAGIELGKGNVFTFEANAPARVVRVRTFYAEKPRLIARPRNKPVTAEDLTTKLTLLVEVWPEAAIVKRRLIAVPVGASINMPAGMTFVDVIENEHSELVALFDGDVDEAVVDRDLKPENMAQPFRAGDVVEVLAGTDTLTSGEKWVIACYDAPRDFAYIAGWPETLVTEATKKLRRCEAATDEQHAQMIADVLASSGPRRAALVAIQARGGTP